MDDDFHTLSYTYQLKQNDTIEDMEQKSVDSLERHFLYSCGAKKFIRFLNQDDELDYYVVIYRNNLVIILKSYASFIGTKCRYWKIMFECYEFSHEFLSKLK